MAEHEGPGGQDVTEVGAPQSGEYEPIAVTGRKRFRRRTRILLVSAVAALLIAGGAWGAFALFGGAEPEPTVATPAPTPEATPDPTPEPETPDPIHVIAMGDMLPHDSVNENARTEDGWDYTQFFDGISSELEAADVTFCNQEVPSAGEEFGVSGYPTFNAPTEFARDLREGVGCDLVNLATNHTADKGAAGVAATRDAWDKLDPAVVAGASRSAEEQRSVPVFEADGVRIALVAFAEYSNAPIDGVSLTTMSDEKLVTELMEQAREDADIVIVSAHWGTEDSHEVNDQQRAFAQRVAELGADVVLGTGPHVLQPATWLEREDGERTLVWYSIGNMLSTQLALDQRTGVIAGFDLVREEPDGPVTVENPTATLTYMHYDWTAAEEAAGTLSARHSLSITPLADSQKLFERTRFDVSAADQLRASADILGPDVTVRSE